MLLARLITRLPRRLTHVCCGTSSGASATSSVAAGTSSYASPLRLLLLTCLWGVCHVLCGCWHVILRVSTSSFATDMPLGRLPRPLGLLVRPLGSLSHPLGRLPRPLGLLVRPLEVLQRSMTLLAHPLRRLPQYLSSCYLCTYFPVAFEII
jgi:hypothetical protein